MSPKSNFEDLGGRALIHKISSVFYEKIYAHPWIGQYFKEISQEIITNQQTDFMTQALGGPSLYSGALPIPAHKHMMITHELFDLREALLRESLTECGASEELIERWLRIDEAFRNRLVKKSREECEKRFTTDEILDFENPEKKAA